MLIYWVLGLIRAYELENKIAVFPRIVIDSEIINEFNEKHKSHGLESVVLRDFDGIYYLNILSFEDDQEMRQDYINFIRSTCEKADSRNDKIRQKVDWMLNYIDYVDKAKK